VLCRFETVGIDQRLVVRRAHTAQSNEASAVAELREQLAPDRASASLLFCSPRYDLEALGREIADNFTTPVAACTTAGQISTTGYVSGGITAVSLHSKELCMRPYLIAPLAACQARAAEVAFSAMSGLVDRGSRRAFGLVLVDGLSGAEERLAASLYQSLGNIPLIGGSAGDELALKATHVYHDGKFSSDAAVFLLFETTLPFAPFKVQHAVPTRHKLVVTAADPERRIVQEINGEPAAEAYAEMLGVELDELDTLLFSKNPVMLHSGGDYYVRTIRRANPDRTLLTFCALEEGLVLTLGESVDPIRALKQGFATLREQIPSPEIVLGCDCILRRMEFEKSGRASEVGDFLARNRVVGFNTYGEQYDAIYVNQTFSAIALSSA
jgi:hypothetical protein